MLLLAINQEAYPSEAARLLQIPLSVAQRYLQRFEEAGLLVRIIRGPLRLFRFNPRFPLHDEVQALLDRAVALLTAEERAAYAIRLRPRRTGKPL